MAPSDPVEFLFRLKTEKPLAWKKLTSGGNYAVVVATVVENLLAGGSAEILWESLLTLTRDSRRSPKPGRPDAVEDLNEVLRLRNAKISVAEIARRLGVSRPTVYKCFRQLDLKTKKEEGARRKL